MRFQQRIEKLEKAVVQPWAFVTRVVCKGSEQTEEEQSRIDDSKSKGGLVIIRRIIQMRPRADLPERSNAT